MYTKLHKSNRCLCRTTVFFYSDHKLFFRAGIPKREGGPTTTKGQNMLYSTCRPSNNFAFCQL